MSEEKNKKKIKFFGNGSMWDAKHGKELCSFGPEGVYETNDIREIGILREAGFKFEGKMEVELDEKTKELKDLKEKVIQLEEVKGDKAAEKLLKKIEKLEESGLEVQKEINEYKRAIDIIAEKAEELGFASKKELKKMDIVQLCEVFISKLEVAPEE